MTPRRTAFAAWLRSGLAALLLGLAPAVSALTLLDDFADPTPWRAVASDQVRSRLSRDADGSLCLHYDFAGVSGYAVMRRELPIAWPAHFELGVRLKGGGGANHLQIKFVDADGDNVWWINRPDTTLPPRLTARRWRQRHVEFAWGPTTDRTLRHTRFVEFVIAAGRDGGRGRLCVARLTLAPRAADPPRWPDPTLATRGGVTTIDWQVVREFNGIALRWPDAARHRLRYRVDASTDGRRWVRLADVRGSDGGLDALFVPEHEARLVRVHHAGLPAPAVELKTAAEWPALNAVLAALAGDAPRGDLPRAFVGEQNHWTLIGVDGGGERSALLSEDGAVEWGRGGPSVEPSLRLADGRVIAWSDVSLSQSLRDRQLPVARVHWRHERAHLDIEAAADGHRDAPTALMRYTVTNAAPAAQTLTLRLALRPWQVNPPQQFLATPGGASPLRRLSWSARDSALAADGRGALRFAPAPARVVAQGFDGGVSLAALASAAPLSRLTDPRGHASALVQWHLPLAPGESRSVVLEMPLAGRAGPSDALPSRTSRAGVGVGSVGRRIDAAAAAWRERLGRVAIELPPSAQPIAETLRMSLAHMLMSRDGAALRPGTRSYARSWVRDGAMMVAALVRLGEIDVAREFVDWYGGFVFASGKVPCCVDARGADPVVENDSHGQYLFAVAEVLRHTADSAFAARHWPRVQRVVAWIDAQRGSERGERNREPGREHFFGLMPPSISHEGYSDKPAYSYWDDFWTLRGLKDAVAIARSVGDPAREREWAASRDQFERDLLASIEAAARVHRIDFIAGAADRGDFDPTSTTIALAPTQAALPEALLAATFERYWRESLARADGTRAWRDLTPYELRGVGAFVRLGQPDRAHALLDFLMRLQRPAAWRQWAEVALPDAREPRFLGDMPHAWVSSDFARSAIDMLAMEVEPDRIVIGAGWRASWLDHPLGVQGLHTPLGRVAWRLERDGARWRLHVGARIAGTLVLRWPDGVPLPQALHDGRALAWQGRELALPAAPATIVLTPP